MGFLARLLGLSGWQATLAAVLAAVVALGAVWGHGRVTGFWKGEAAAKASHAAALRAKQDEISDLGEEVARIAAALALARQQRAIAAQEVDDAARGNPDYARPGIGPDGLLRLERHWSAR